MAHHEARVVQRQASRAGPRNRATKRGTADHGYFLSGRKRRRDAFPADSKLPTSQSTSANLPPPTCSWRCTCGENLPGQPFFGHHCVSRQSALAHLVVVAFQSGRPGDAPFRSCPISFAADQSSIFLAATLTLLDSFITNRRVKKKSHQFCLLRRVTRPKPLVSASPRVFVPEQMTMAQQVINTLHWTPTPPADALPFAD